MQRRVWALACALCLLAGCGGQEAETRSKFLPPPVAVREQAEEVSEEPLQTEEQPPEGFVPLPERELRPYEEWTFVPEPYLVTVEEYGELFSLKEEVYDSNGWKMVGYRRPKGLLEDYRWYGVPEMFPFLALADQGLREGTRDWQGDAPLICDEAYAMACRYYTRVIEFSDPDGTQYVEQESNYPQFERSARWYWADFGAGWTGEDHGTQFSEWAPFEPAQPKAYGEPIRIQAAMMNWNADGWLPDNDLQNLEVYAGLTLSERTALQNAWVTVTYGDRCPAEASRCYAATGLTLLNGDSRTEDTYFAGSRAREIRITVNETYTKEVTLADSPAPQLISLEAVQPTIAKPLDITIEVLSSYPGRTEDVYITEIGVGLASNLPQGR